MKFLKAVLFGTLATLASVAQAGVVDFKALANAAERGYALSGLTINAGGGIAAASGGTGATFLTVYAIEGSYPNFIHPYLDSGNAGLGACNDLTAAFQCTPSNDDNVTTDAGGSEALFFVFAQSVNLGNIFLNNNHDGDKSLLGDSVLINGVARQLLNGGVLQDSSYDLGSLGINPTTGFTIGHTGATCTGENTSSQDCEFYVSKLEWTSVPAPAPLALFGLGLLGMGAIRRRAG
ncbi:MAG: hypothetical protein ACFHX7_07050 [Pseudomonadota bacterium]